MSNHCVGRSNSIEFCGIEYRSDDTLNPINFTIIVFSAITHSLKSSANVCAAHFLFQNTLFFFSRVSHGDRLRTATTMFRWPPTRMRTLHSKLRSTFTDFIATVKTSNESMGHGLPHGVYSNPKRSHMPNDQTDKHNGIIQSVWILTMRSTAKNKIK